MTHVAWSVCWSHGGILCKYGGTDRDAVWGWTLVGPRNHVLDGVEIPTGRDNFGGCTTHYKALGVCCDIRSKLDHSLLNNGMTVRLPQLGVT